MKTISTLLLSVFFCSTSFAQQQFPFVENKNQWPNKVLYKADIPGGILWLEKTNFIFDLSEFNPHDQHSTRFNNESITTNDIKRHAYKVSFENANQNVQIKSISPSSDYCNYIIGNNPSKWSNHVYKYEAIYYSTIYPHIDMKVYSSGVNYKYDFFINKKGNPSDIRIKYDGCDKIEIIEGNLTIYTSAGKVKELHPNAYQQIKGERKKISCNFNLEGNIVSFEFPDGYNNEYQLVIDPELVFATYTGSTTDNWGFTATYDNLGNSYSGGICFNIGYPVSIGAYQVTYGGGEYAGGSYYGCDLAVIKYDTSGTQRLWATYLGGTFSEEMPHSMICDKNNNLIIMGTTGSSDFPTTINSYDNSFNGGTNVTYDNVIKFSNGTDIYLSKLSNNGTTLLGSTFIGGSSNDGLNFRPYYNNYLVQGNDSLYYNYMDGARGEVVCDENNNIYVGSCTFSNNFPVTPGSFNSTYNGKQEGIVFKFNSNLSQLLWSSFLGGSLDDVVNSITLDEYNDVYVCGGTLSTNLPTTTGVFHTNYLGGTSDGFVFHISENGNSILGGTYFGSPLYDQAYFVKTDKQRNIYIVGQTKAPAMTLIINASYYSPNSGQFIAKFPNNLSYPIWSTVFGSGIGRPNISLSAFEVDICNRIYVSGWGREWANSIAEWASIQGTKNMQVTPNAFNDTTDGQDFYLMVLSSDASQLEYATFIGEIHPTGSNIYCGHDHVDGGTSRFDKKGHLYQSVCASCGIGCNGFPTSSGSWSPNNGGSTSSNWICNNALFSFSFFSDFANASLASYIPNCYPYTISFNNNVQGSTFLWNFGDGDTSTISEPTHTYNQPGNYSVILVVTDSLTCNISDTALTTVQVQSPIIDTLPTMNILPGGSTQIGVTPDSSGLYSYQWFPNYNLSNSYISNPLASPDTSTQYLLVVSHGSCTDSIYQTVIVSPMSVNPELFGSNQNEHFFLVFPNPVDYKFIIRFNEIKESLISFELINELGEAIIIYPKKKFAPGEYSVEFNLNSLELCSGIYYLKLINEDIIEVKKILIQ